MSKKTEIIFVEENEWKDFYDRDINNDIDYTFIEEKQEFDHFESMKGLLHDTSDKQPETQQVADTNISIGEENHNETRLTLKELKLKHALNWGFMQTSVRSILDIEDINDEFEVSLKEADLIVTECHRLNKEKANKNNPNCNQPCKIFSTTKKHITMAKIMDEYSVDFEIIKNISRKYQIADIWNPNSYTTPQNTKRITEELSQLAKQNNHKNTTCIDFETLLKENYKIFIDTSSLMQFNTTSLMNETLIPLLEKYNAQIYVIDSVIYEIEVKVNSHDDQALYKKASMARSLLDKLFQKGLCATANSHSRSKKYADAEFISLFTDLRLVDNLCLITNDYSKDKDGGLSGSIMRLKTDPNIYNIKDIRVFSVSTQKGDSPLVEFFLEENYSSLFSYPIPRVEL